MENSTFDILTSKLKNAPQSVLERVIGYIDALVEPNFKPYQLNKKQQELLDKQVNLDKNAYYNVDTLLVDIKKKYEL